MRKSINIFRNFFLILGALFFCLMLMELTFQAYHFYVKQRTKYQSAEHPDMIYTVKPNVSREINTRGFRDREHSDQKPPGTTRILIIGDSVTRGYGIQDVADRYTDLLEERLHASGEKFEIINFGMDQYATVQQSRLLTEWGIAMQPDRLIISYVLNDPTSDGSINDFFLRENAPSMALHWMLKKINAIETPIFQPPVIPGCKSFDYYSKMHCDAEKWETVRSSFQKIRDLSIAHNFPVLLAVFPLLDEDPQATFQDYPWHAIHQQVLAEAQENGFDTLDLLPAFAKYKPVDLKIKTSDRLHPNELGHRTAADAIFTKLSSLNPKTSPKNSQITRGIDDE